jgi:hypothetical protein
MTAQQQAATAALLHHNMAMNANTNMYSTPTHLMQQQSAIDPMRALMAQFDSQERPAIGVSDTQYAQQQNKVCYCLFGGLVYGGFELWNYMFVFCCTA